MSNHTATNLSLNRFNIVDNPNCQCGNFHTIDHILFECRLSRNQNIINKFKHIGYKEPLYVGDIVGVELQNKFFKGMIIISEGCNDQL